MIYLDNAATTLKKPRDVYLAAADALHSCGSPGRGGHEWAKKAGDIVFVCRERAAKLFSVSNPENVVFTFNATHGLNIAINSVVTPGMRVLTSGYEHNSVLRPLTAIGAEIVPVGTGEFCSETILEEFENELKNGADAAVVNHVSNVFGCIQPIDSIGKLCRRYNVPLVVDASQSAGCLPINMETICADFIAMPGHKGLYGPQGTGLLLCGGRGVPLLYGGSGSDSLKPDMPEYLPDRLEAGTHNMTGIAGLSQGLKYVLEKMPEAILRKEQTLIKRACEGLGSIPGVTIYRPGNEPCAGVLSFNIGGLDPEECAQKFSYMGIGLRAGLHCAPMAHRTMGTIDRGTVRLSVSDFTTTDEIYRFLKAANKIAGGACLC